MTIREENKLNMYNSVKTVCDANRELWQAVGAFVRAYDQFTEKLAVLAPETSVKNQSTTGITQDKTLKRESMCSLAAANAALLLALADEKGDLALKSDVNYSYAAIMRQRENAVTTLCRNILKHTRARLNELSDYGIDPNAAKVLETAIVAYEAVQTKPRTIQAQTKNARQNVERLIGEIDELLYNRMDNLMEGFSRKNGDFYNQYNTVRTMVNRGGSRTMTDEPVSVK